MITIGTSVWVWLGIPDPATPGKPIDPIVAESQHAQDICLAAAKASAEYPSSVKVFWPISPSPTKSSDGTWISSIAVEAKNNIGNMLPKMIRCETHENKLIKMSVRNR